VEPDQEYQAEEQGAGGPEGEEEPRRSPKQLREDLVTLLVDAGEEAVHKVGDLLGFDRFKDYANSTRDRLDELNKRVQGISALEARIAALEEEVAVLSKSATPAPKRAAARKDAG
jgi:BMFP domain-containing protein YqiC